MKPGTQIAYIPMHAKGNINHPDVEFGFIALHTAGSNAAFCRYWRKGEPGMLRTTANSELTPIDMIVEHVSVDQDLVNGLLLELYSTD